MVSVDMAPCRSWRACLRIAVATGNIHYRIHDLLCIKQYVHGMWAMTYTSGRAAHIQASHIVDWMVHNFVLVAAR
jgi:hypothetical protein